MNTYADEHYVDGQHVHVTFLETVTFPELVITVNHKPLLGIHAEHVTVKHYAQVADVQTLVGTFCEIPEGFSFEGDSVVSISVRSENYDAIMETLHEVTVVTRLD